MYIYNISNIWMRGRNSPGNKTDFAVISTCHVCVPGTRFPCTLVQISFNLYTLNGYVLSKSHL